MMEHLTNVAVGGILAMLIIRQVFDFLSRRKDLPLNGGQPQARPITTELHSIGASLTKIVGRLDRILDRFEHLAETAKTTRRQVEINGESAERINRHLDKIDDAVNRIELAAKRTPETQPT